MSPFKLRARSDCDISNFESGKLLLVRTAMRFWQNALPFRSFCARTFTAALAIALLLAMLTKSQAADVEHKRVMMLHSFGLRFKPWTDYARIIRSEISRQSRTPIDFHDHSLLNARQDDEKSDSAFVEYLHTLYADQPLDLIVALGAPAANFVQRYPESSFFREHPWCLRPWSSAGFSTTS